MEFETVQSGALKTMFEVLKDILTDVNFVFGPGGATVVAFDSARVACVYLKLDAKKFERYACEREIVAGMTMSNMYKIMRIVGTNDSIKWSIDDPSRLDIHVTNEAKRSKTHFSVNLLDIDDDMIAPPKLKMDASVAVPSTDFQKLCRDMGNLGHDLNVDITRTKGQVEFKCSGDFARQATVLESGLADDGTASGCYPLKYINTFTKATSMCPSVQLFIENDYPLIIKYDVAQLGEICFCLAAKD